MTMDHNYFMEPPDFEAVGKGLLTSCPVLWVPGGIWLAAVENRMLGEVNRLLICSSKASLMFDYTNAGRGKRQQCMEKLLGKQRCFSLAPHKCFRWTCVNDFFPLKTIKSSSVNASWGKHLKGRISGYRKSYELLSYVCLSALSPHSQYLIKIICLLISPPFETGPW